MAADFAQFLARSLAQLAAGAPAIHRRLCAHLEGHAVRIVVGTSSVTVTGAGEALNLHTGPDAPAHSVELRTCVATILRLVDGDVSLEDAVLAEEVELFGVADELARFHDALILYLQGAVRCAAMVPLLRAFRADARGGCHVGAEVER